MDLDLAGKKVLIAGGSRGIGFECAKSFLAEGAVPILIGRDLEHLKTASRQLNNCDYHVCDLQHSVSTQQLVDTVGVVDILINCAGSTPKIPTSTLNIDKWQIGLNRKLWTYLNIIDPMIKKMSAVKSGVIINVIGIGGKFYSENHLVGGTANTALMMVTAGYARDYAADNIRVIGINPAGVTTERLHEIVSQLAQSRQISFDKMWHSMLADYPQKEFVRMETVTSTIVFLSSHKAHSITGTTVQIDGARSPTV